MLPEKLDEIVGNFRNQIRIGCKDLYILTELIAGLANSGGGIIQIDCEHSYTIDFDGIDPSLDVITERGIVIVPDAPMKPYLYQGKIPLIKNGRLTYPSRTELLNMLKTGAVDFTAEARWPVKDVFFDTEKIHLLRNRLEELFGASVGDIFKSVGLVKNDFATATLILLCGKDPEIFIPGSSIILQIQGRGIEKITGHLSGIVDKLFHLISSKVTEVMENYELVNSHFRDCLNELLREIIVNALIHRDYSVPIPVTVNYMDMEIRVWNPGAPAGEKGVPAPSSIYIRNPHLYKFAGIMGLARASGSGLLRLSKTALMCNNVQLVYEKSQGGTLATLSFKSTVQSRRLNEREKKLLEYIKNTGYITRKDYEKLMGVSERTARLDLSNLVKRGILKKTGKGKNTVYELV